MLFQVDEKGKPKIIAFLSKLQVELSKTEVSTKLSKKEKTSYCNSLMMNNKDSEETNQLHVNLHESSHTLKININ